MNDSERLEAVKALLDRLPVTQGASAEEPWVMVNLVDLTAIFEVAAGVSSPADWLHVPCSRAYGHAPHHWSEYRAGSIPIRVPHYCEGVVS